MLEPSDSQEAKDFVAHAFELSEQFDTPVLLRMTTRVCHSKTVVEIGAPPVEAPKATGFVRDFDKFVLLPRQAMRPMVRIIASGRPPVRISRILIWSSAIGSW